jgi:hypothetical protein
VIIRNSFFGKVFFILTGFYNTAKLSVECVAVCNESPEMLVENFLITAKKVTGIYHFVCSSSWVRFSSLKTMRILDF